MNKIWVLFSMADDYGNSTANLEAWWIEKPSFVKLANVLNLQIDLNKGDRKIGGLLKGQEVRIDSTYYRLEYIKEGKYNSEDYV